MKNLLLLSSLTCFLILSGCTTVTYLGGSYAQTNQVDVFYDENKINGDYEIMGHAVSESIQLDELESKLVERAKQEGADAVIIYSLDRNSVAEGTSQNQLKASFVKYL